MVYTMATRTTVTYWVVALATGCALSTRAGAVPDVEKQLIAADTAWIEQSAAAAVPGYVTLLEALPPEGEPFRATVIMRLARARHAVGDRAGAEAALALLGKMVYVPEHHALAAKELQAVMAGRPHPGQQRTPIPAAPKPQATLHVRAGAAEGGDGSAARPFARVQAAVITARTIRNAGREGAIEVVLAPGTYLLKEPVRLSAEDAGTADAPLIIRSQHPDRPATLTGGTVLTRWTPVADPALRERLPEAVRDNVRVCDLKAHGIAELGELVFGGFSSARAEGKHCRFFTFPVPELFYRGSPQTMARWPDDRLTRLPINEAAKNELPRYRRWAREIDLWLHGYWHHDWADAYEKVAAVEENGAIRLETPTNRYGFRRKQGCAVNALCELDQPSEWFLDTKGGRVCYLPPPAFDPHRCVLSSFGSAIVAEACAHLQIRDLRISFVRGDAVTFQDCSDLVVAGLDIQDCSGLGIRIDGGKRHLVHSCRIQSMGRGGIDLRAGDWQKLDASGTIVENCVISDLSRIDRTYTPALLLDGMGVKIRHSLFADIPSSAIRLEACDALIELTRFRRCVYESGDQGAIDMWANPLYRGNIIRWNDFDSIANNTAHLGAAAVRHDDYISGFMVAQNVFRQGSRHGFGSVQFNQGTDNYVEGNVIVDWHKAFSGGSMVGKHWAGRITGHPNSQRILAATEWQSEAWKTKYPMVRDLMNGDDNHNYLVGNLRLGSGSWGGVGHAISLANREGDRDVHAGTLENVRPHLVPWYPIPLDRIGPYSVRSPLDSFPVTVSGPFISGKTPFAGEATVTIAANLPGRIAYTLDGSDPGPDATVYTAPIVLKEAATVKAVLLGAAGDRSAVASASFEGVIPHDATSWVTAIEALERRGVEIEEEGTIGHCENGDSVSYLLDLGQTPVNKFELEYAVPEQYANQRMHIHLDSPKGRRIGTVRFPATGSFQTFKEHAVAVEPVAGLRQVHFVFQGGSGICNLKRFRFAP